MKRLTILLTLTTLCTVAMTAQRSPYIHRVYDFCPAPGQFVNELPEYEEGDTYETILAKVNECLCDDERTLVSLGAYGGYVVFGFDHPVVNVPESRDFKVLGNAFVSSRAKRAGSCEPGIVMVSRDVNGNGVPDDPWYELAGSEYGNPRTLHDYQITYYRPDENKTPTPSPTVSMIVDDTYIRWTSNDPDSLAEGYVCRLNPAQFHDHSYWPQWLADQPTLSFAGAKLPCNAEDINGDGTYWVQHFFDWGYADNLPNNEDEGFDLDWAVDAQGNPFKLTQVDFIKVYNAVNQYCGWLGETSTEVMGAIDLHPDAEPVVARRGDVNCDNVVDVLDVSLLIDVVLGNLAASDLPGDCHVAGNAVIDVTDINVLIDIVLGNAIQ